MAGLAVREAVTLIGTGVAATSFSASEVPSSATVTPEADEAYTMAIGAAGIGNGARIALTAVAVDALGTTTDQIRLRPGPAIG